MPWCWLGTLTIFPSNLMVRKNMPTSNRANNGWTLLQVFLTTSLSHARCWYLKNSIQL